MNKLSAVPASSEERKLALRFLVILMEPPSLLGCEISQLSLPLLWGHLPYPAHPECLMDSEAYHSEDLQTYQPKKQEVYRSPPEDYAGEHGEAQEAYG